MEWTTEARSRWRTRWNRRSGRIRASTRSFLQMTRRTIAAATAIEAAAGAWVIQEEWVGQEVAGRAEVEVEAGAAAVRGKNVRMGKKCCNESRRKRAEPFLKF